MRKLFLILGIACSLALGVAGIAQASAASPHGARPDLTSPNCYYFTNNGDGGRLWYNTNTQTFQTKTVASGHYTVLCWQASGLLVVDPAKTNCMSWYNSGSLGANLVSEHQCNDLSYESWEPAAGAPPISFANEDATSTIPCANGYGPFMDSTGSTGTNVTMSCLNGIAYTNDQLWTQTQVSG